MLAEHNSGELLADVNFAHASWRGSIDKRVTACGVIR